MANSLAALFRRTNLQLANNFLQWNRITIIDHQVRKLYAKNSLGLDGFLQQRERVRNQFANVSNKFIEKMKEFTADGSKNMVFTEDLKNMVHLADSDEQIELVVKMMKQFAKQNSQMRFGNFVFGPVVMRMFHANNKPDLAFQCFKAPELQGFFDQIASYQILLDLLYENQKYQEVLEALDIIKDKQLEGMKYPKNVIVLAYAALYKINSKESLDRALKLWKELQEFGHIPMRRASTFCAGLALRQGEPGVALEIISAVNNQMYTTIRGIKAAALAQLGRVEDAVVILKSILTVDRPVNVKLTFSKDVVETVKTAVEKLDKPDTTAEFNRIYDIFKAEGHISEMTLDEQLCSEIEGPSPRLRDPTRNRMPRFQRGPDDVRRAPRINSYNTVRPGLAELQ